VTVTRRRVLICEDEDMIRELIRVSLAGGYAFIEATTVAEAHEALAASTPHVLLVDLMLPGGSGLDVIRALRRQPAGADVPAVVISAWTTREYRAAADDAGADSFVAKPFVPDELAALVARLVGER
jgi:two-component system phosphate regulon response regulator PhoB